jgi:hypothetical protein
VLGVVRLDPGRDVSALLLRQALEAFLAHRGHDFPRRVDREHTDSVLLGEEEDVAVIAQ